MYERFTERARKVMALASQEAQLMCHRHLGTEHILLGLIREGSGIASSVLANLEVSLVKARLEVEKLSVRGPEMVTLGELPHTPLTNKLIDHAIEEARDLNHNYVGTEHLLLGLLREPNSVAVQVLLNLGLKLEDVREEALNILGADSVEEREEQFRAEHPSMSQPPPKRDERRIATAFRQIAHQLIVVAEELEKAQ